MLQSILHAYKLNIRCIRDIREHGNAVGADGASDDVIYVLTRYHGISFKLNLLYATPDALHL
jgi:hypothetical protein